MIQVGGGDAPAALFAFGVLRHIRPIPILQIGKLRQQTCEAQQLGLDDELLSKRNHLPFQFCGSTQDHRRVVQHVSGFLVTATRVVRMYSWRGARTKLLLRRSARPPAHQLWHQFI